MTFSEQLRSVLNTLGEAPAHWSASKSTNVVELTSGQVRAIDKTLRGVLDWFNGLTGVKFTAKEDNQMAGKYAGAERERELRERLAQIGFHADKNASIDEMEEMLAEFREGLTPVTTVPVPPADKASFLDDIGIEADRKEAGMGEQRDAFSIGSKVKLKSGSPIMTVEEISNESSKVLMDATSAGGTLVHCVWFVFDSRSGGWTGPCKASFKSLLLEVVK